MTWGARLRLFSADSRGTAGELCTPKDRTGQHTGPESLEKAPTARAVTNRGVTRALGLGSRVVLSEVRVSWVVSGKSDLGNSGSRWERKPRTRERGRPAAEADNSTPSGSRDHRDAQLRRTVAPAVGGKAAGEGRDSTWTYADGGTRRQGRKGRAAQKAQRGRLLSAAASPSSP